MRFAVLLSTESRMYAEEVLETKFATAAPDPYTSNQCAGFAIPVPIRTPLYSVIVIRGFPSR